MMQYLYEVKAEKYWSDGIGNVDQFFGSDIGQKEEYRPILNISNLSNTVNTLSCLHGYGPFSKVLLFIGLRKETPVITSECWMRRGTGLT